MSQDESSETNKHLTEQTMETESHHIVGKIEPTGEGNTHSGII